jgi:hypothetical protein
VPAAGASEEAVVSEEDRPLDSLVVRWVLSEVGEMGAFQEDIRGIPARLERLVLLILPSES